MTKFQLTGALEGKSIILGMNQYQFVDGIYECRDEDADKIGVILSNYYQAKRVVEVAAPAKDAEPTTEKPEVQQPAKSK